MTRVARDPRGQSLVEFALLIPVLLLLVMGLFDFGRAIYAYNAISNAAREGARIAIVDQTVSGGVPVGAQEAADQATALGLDPTDVNDVQVRYLMDDLTTTCPDRWINCIAEVRVQYVYTPITPIVGRILGPITLSSTTQLPIEHTEPDT